MSEHHGDPHSFVYVGRDSNEGYVYKCSCNRAWTTTQALDDLVANRAVGEWDCPPSSQQHVYVRTCDECGVTIEVSATPMYETPVLCPRCNRLVSTCVDREELKNRASRA